MSIRDTINSRPRITAAIIAVIVVIAIGSLIWQITGGSFGPEQAPLGKRFYTTDDGKSWFPESIDKVPPYNTSDGKTAYRANVVQCKDGQPYVAYVEKFTPAQKKLIEEMFADPARRSLAIEAVMSLQEGLLVKKPMEADGWIGSEGGAKFDALVLPRCRDGGTPKPIFPAK